MDHHSVAKLWRFFSKMTLSAPDRQYLSGGYFAMETPDAGMRVVLILSERTENVVFVS